MEVGELEELFRTWFDDDTPSDQLVSPDSFLEYLNEAQEEACIRSMLLFDRTSAITIIDISTGKSTYVIDESIYTIVEAFITDAAANTTRINITNRVELDRILPDWRQGSGRPEHLVHYDDHIEISYSPSEDFTLNLECYLLPDSLSSDSDKPQINKANHRKLLHWVMYRAYGSQDNEIFDSRKSLQELSMFEKVFGRRPSAKNRKNEYSNRLHKNKVCI